jgi:predicted DNA-binding transcriptional regulator YafY
MASLGVLPRTAAAQTLSLLQYALGRGQALWVGYVDQHGSVTERVVDPIRLEGGYLTGYDHRYEEVRTFAVHRITGVAVLDPSSASPASPASSAVDAADAADVRPVDETDPLPSDAQPTDVRGPA